MNYFLAIEKQLVNTPAGLIYLGNPGWSRSQLGKFQILSNFLLVLTGGSLGDGMGFDANVFASLLLSVYVTIICLKMVLLIMGNIDLVSIGALLSAMVALGTLIALLLEYRRSNSVKRAGYIADMIDKFRGDSDIREVLYDFQYDLFNYSIDFHQDTEAQRRVDKALLYLSYVCYLAKKGIIAKDDFSFFEIDLSQTLTCPDVVDYLFNLYHLESLEAAGSSSEIVKPQKRQRGSKYFPFSFLIKYGVERGLITKDFFDFRNAGNGRYHNYVGNM